MKIPRVLITAGATHEAIDPIRIIISNKSSGKMGYELACAFQEIGCYVFGLLGSVSVNFPIEYQNAYNASDMLTRADALMPNFDIFISVAAVADYKPIEVQSEKIKGQQVCILFEKNTDVLQNIYNKYPDKLIVGFALETDNGIENAILKLHKADIIVCNSPCTISSDNSKASIITSPDNVVNLPSLTKRDLAQEIVKYAMAHQKISPKR